MSEHAHILTDLSLLAQSKMQESLRIVCETAPTLELSAQVSLLAPLLLVQHMKTAIAHLPGASELVAKMETMAALSYAQATADRKQAAGVRDFDGKTR